MADEVTQQPPNPVPDHVSDLRVRPADVPDPNAQAKAAMVSKVQPDTASPAEIVVPGAAQVHQAYQAASDRLSGTGKAFSQAVLAPFRQGLDNMAEDLQNAGETGHTKSGGQLSEPARALASGVGTALKYVPVGKDVTDTVQANIVPPELSDLRIKISPQQVIEDAGLVYKGELSKGSGVHMMEHPAHPGKTAALKESEITPEAVRNKMTGKLAEFGVQPVEGLRVRTGNNASGESAASQEAINRVASEKAQGKTRVSIDTRSGQETPLHGTDAVDAKPATPYHRIVERGPKGEITVTEGAKARPTPAKAKIKAGAEEKEAGAYDLGDID